MDLSIVIRCCNDYRVLNCLKSIDVPECDKIVVLNGSSALLRKMLTNVNVRIVGIPERNMSLAQNVGIDNSIFNKVLLMDSDCVFAPGGINFMYESMLPTVSVVRAKVIFRYRGFSSRIGAYIRLFHDSYESKAYTPGLLIRKRIKDTIGGYFFNPNINWTDDDDFDRRLKWGDVKIRVDNRAILYHDAEGIRQSLKGAFKYGRGRCLQHNSTPFHFQLLKNIKKTFKNALKISKSFGLLTAAFYVCLWKPFYFIGFYCQRFGKFPDIHTRSSIAGVEKSNLSSNSINVVKGCRDVDKWV